jgi:hypothetical protein
LREQDTARHSRPRVLLRGQDLKVFSGDPTGPEAHAFHPIEMQRVLSFYGSQHPHMDARRFVKKAIEIRGIEQVRWEIMSFFERPKTEASAEWRENALVAEHATHRHPAEGGKHLADVIRVHRRVPYRN